MHNFSVTLSHKGCGRKFVAFFEEVQTGKRTYEVRCSHSEDLFNLEGLRYTIRPGNALVRRLFTEYDAIVCHCPECGTNITIPFTEFDMLVDRAYKEALAKEK